MEFSNKKLTRGYELTENNQAQILSNITQFNIACSKSVADNTNPKNIIHISSGLGGKMEGIKSITTNPYNNPNCLARLSRGVGVCKHCFSALGGIKNYKDFNKWATYNSLVLSQSIIDLELLPIVNDLVIRLESHGDLINTIQVINYFNICKVNPSTKFTLWTKNPNYIATVINKGYKKPSNLTVIYSSQNLNQINSEILKRYTFIDKVFTVFTAKYAIDNNITINCGTKNCIRCQNCYKLAKNSPVFINEILKDQITEFLTLGGVVR